MALTFRKYEPGDEAAILDLFHKSFGKPLKAEYWRWRFLNNPLGEPMIDLAWDGPTLAAHYGVSPVAVDVHGEPRPSALSMTTMTHPQYRGQGLFPKLAASLYDRLKQSGYFMVWGFPNDQSHRGFVHDLGWQDVSEIPMLRLEAPQGREQVSGNISDFTEFEQAFDDLWPRARSGYQIAVRRERKFLRWRFHLDSGNSYRFLGCRERGEWLGYAAYKTYGTELDLVDILVVPDAGADAQLLTALLDVCAREGLKAINTWVPLRDPTRALLEKMGFRNSAPITYLGARSFSGNQPEVSDVRCWRYSMADSDVF
jgi:GNAT superfamily N-acetyltransferase